MNDVNTTDNTQVTEIAGKVDAVLKAIEPIKQSVDQQYKEQIDEWQREIAMLESRVANETVTIYLDKEMKCPFKIRACLSEKEIEEIADLLKQKDDAIKNNDTEHVNELTYLVLSKIVANPLMRDPAWFRNNKDKYSQQDLLVILIAFLENIGNRVQEIVDIQNFRKKSNGTELWGKTPISRNTRPKRMGGTPS